MAMYPKLFVLGEICKPIANPINTCPSYRDYNGCFIEIDQIDNKNLRIGYLILDKDRKRMKHCNCFRMEDLEKVDIYKDFCKGGEKNMSTLSAIAKSMVDKDTQVLVEAGFLDSQLNLTSMGAETLQSILLANYKEEFVKMARKIVRKSKKGEDVEDEA